MRVGLLVDNFIKQNNSGNNVSKRSALNIKMNCPCDIFVNKQNISFGGGDIEYVDYSPSENNIKTFIKASEVGNNDRIISLLKKGINPNVQDYSGNTALHKASLRGHVSTVKLLLENGADPNLLDENIKLTPLMLAAAFGRKEIVKLLLGYNADINYKKNNGFTELGNTALMSAVSSGKTDVVKLLLENGADPDIEDGYGKTALERAQKANNTECARIISEYMNNSGLIKSDITKYTPTDAEVKTFMDAARRGNNREIKELLDKGIDPNVVDDYGDSALANACAYKYASTVKLLLESGADPNICGDLNLSTALMTAVTFNQKAITNLLLEHKANINQKDKKGSTALHRACMNDKEMISILLQNGADIDAQINDGTTPLMSAVEADKPEIVKLLLDNGANPDIKDYNLGLTAYDKAYQVIWQNSAKILKTYGSNLENRIKKIVNNNPYDFDISKVTELLSEPEAKDAVNMRFNDQANSTLLHLLAAHVCRNENERNEQLSLVLYLIKLGADLNAVNNNGLTPIEIAINNNNFKLITFFIEKGAGSTNPNVNVQVFDNDNSIKREFLSAVSRGDLYYVNKLINSDKNIINSQDDKGMTALMIAVTEDQEEIVNALLELRADPNIKSNTGKTALMYAVAKGQTYIVKQLLKSKADPYIKSISGDSALTIAVSSQNVNMVKVLLEAGVDPNILNNFNDSVLMLAVRSENDEIARLLLDNKANPDLKKLYGKTPLAYAAYRGMYEMVKLLTDYKADPYIKDNNGETPLELAIKGRNKRCEEILREYTENKTKTSEMTNRIKSIIKEKPYEFSLDIILVLNTTEATELAKIRFEDQNSTLLHLLVGRKIEDENQRKKQLGLISDLIKHDADINAKNEVGNTPLTIASMRGDEMLVKFLLENKADPNIMNSYNFKPIDYARKFKHKGIENLLQRNKDKN